MTSATKSRDEQYGKACLHPLSPLAPVRPLLLLVVLLIAASELGLRAPLRENPLACVLLGVLVAAVCPPRFSRKTWLPLALLFSLSLLRAQGLVFPVGEATGIDSGQPSQTVSESDLRVGRFRALGPGLGWLEQDRNRRPDVLFQLPDSELVDGEWIAIPNRLEAVPWPRGPQPGPMALRFPRGVERLRADEIVRLAGGPTDVSLSFAEGRSFRAGLIASLARLRASLADRTSALFAPEVAGIARALLFGDRSQLSADVADLFTRTGTRHLLAVSGLHIALAAWLVFLPLSRLVLRVLGPTLGTWLELLVFVALLLLFTGLTGKGPPVVRAALALALASIAGRLPRRSQTRPVRGRQADGLSLWALALSLELLIDPHATRSISIQLSYMATLGILLGTRTIGRGLASLPGVLIGSLHWQLNAPLDRRTGIWWRAPLQRIGRSVRLGLAASCSAVLATLPVVWSQFGEFSPVGVLATTLALPLFAIVMGALWSSATFALGFGFESLVHIADRSLVGLVSLLEIVDRLPFTPLPLPARPAALVALASACALFGTVSRAPRLRRTAAICFGLLLLPWNTSPRELELELLDVGHGCALLVRAPGEPCLIFDVGSRDRRHLYREAIAPQLARWDVARPTIALSHDDRDHASGLGLLIERYPPHTWLGELPDSLAGRLPADCARLDLPTGSLSLRRLETPLDIRLLRGSGESGNEGSRALLLELADRRVLLMGDSEGPGLRGLLDCAELKATVDLLLFPHHGSDTVWLSALLELTRPARVWVSADSDPALAREFDRRGLNWSLTSRRGPISLTLGPRKFGSEQIACNPPPGPPIQFAQADP